jgi:hypothetical protein
MPAMSDITDRDPIAEILAQIGREYAQQTRARDHHDRHSTDKLERAEHQRFGQGRWAFRESARLICQHTGRDFQAWLHEWSDTEGA